MQRGTPSQADVDGRIGVGTLLLVENIFGVLEKTANAISKVLILDLHLDHMQATKWFTGELNKCIPHSGGHRLPSRFVAVMMVYMHCRNSYLFLSTFFVLYARPVDIHNSFTFACIRTFGSKQNEEWS